MDTKDAFSEPEEGASVSLVRTLGSPPWRRHFLHEVNCYYGQDSAPSLWTRNETTEHGVEAQRESNTEKVSEGEVCMKIMGSVFWHKPEGYIGSLTLRYIVYEECTVYFSCLLRERLYPSLRRKRLELIQSGVILHMDSAWHHTAHLTMKTIRELGLRQSPYLTSSPEILLFLSFPGKWTASEKI